jgi:hypothetical protein
MFGSGAPAVRGRGAGQGGRGRSSPEEWCDMEAMEERRRHVVVTAVRWLAATPE